MHICKINTPMVVHFQELRLSAQQLLHCMVNHRSLDISAIPSHVQLFKDAMQEIMDKTMVNGKKCIDFQPRTSEAAYIQFSYGSGYVRLCRILNYVKGRIGGLQIVHPLTGNFRFARSISIPF